MASTNGDTDMGIMDVFNVDIMRKKVTVNATLDELEEIGIDDDIIDHKGKITLDFHDGWYEVEINYQARGKKITSKFDIPKGLLKLI